MLFTVTGAAAGAWSWGHGYTTLDGDAEAHLNIARRVTDSRTPGPEQLGTVWLPLPHVLWMPFVMRDSWWRSGLAGVIPSVVLYGVAAAFLFAAGCQAFESVAAGWIAAAAFALNPNVLYFATVPMTEIVFAASLALLLWSLVRFRDAQDVPSVLIAAAAMNAAALIRYEGWFLIPFAAWFVFSAARHKNYAAWFAALALLAPLAWLAHNRFYYSDALAFYRGPYSAQALHAQQAARGIISPTDHRFFASLWYFLEAVREVAGAPLFLLGFAGAIVAAMRRLWLPLGLIVLLPAFYIWSLFAAGTDLYVPAFWPHQAYNTRYAIPMVVAAAFALGGLVRFMPQGWRATTVSALVIAAAAGALLNGPVCFQEAAANSQGRRDAQTQVATFLRLHYQRGSGILFDWDLVGGLREAGIPLSEGLYVDNRPWWDLALAQPAAHLHETWILAFGGSLADSLAVSQHYTLWSQFPVSRTRVIHLYHRS